MEYFVLAEKMWQDWKQGALEPLPNSFVSKTFNLNYLPEPYLKYGTGERAMYFLSTNPGALNPWQERNAIISGKSPNVNPNLKYDEISQNLANFYSSPKFSKKSRSRIDKQIAIQNEMGLDYMITYECFPLHSAALPKKQVLINKLDDFLSIYTKSLKKHIKGKSIIYVSAIGTRESISKKSIKNNSWLLWVMGLIDMDFDNAKIFPLTNKKDKITSALLLEKKTNGVYKGITLMQGSNNIPANIPEIVKLLKR